MNNWVLKDKLNKDIKIKEDFNISPLLLKILNNRDIYTDEDVKLILSNDIKDLHDESKLPNIDKASDILIEKIKTKKKIKIIGDYDIDGVCATYILYDSIKKLGGDVSYYIPNRIKDGYGINKSIIDECIKENIDTIITCDNGISAIEEIKYAKENGITVIVTDHHESSDVLPNADVIVDPKIKDSIYPFKDICGAVVAWKVIRYLKSRMINNYDIKNDVSYLEFICLATIGDIMPIVNENHIIAKLGLLAIQNTKNKGLYKLLEVSNLINKNLSTYHIGFIIGPMINAAGRLLDATLSLELFLSDDDYKINDITNKLKLLNEERKNYTEDGVKKAIDVIEKKYSDDRILVIYIENINESVCGIIAGRIKELYNKPTIILTDTIDEGIIKASARSIEKYDMFNGLNIHKDLLLKFGGHKGAAGFSMKKENLDFLRKYLNDECDLSTDDFVKNIYIDSDVPIQKVTKDIIKEIESIEPFGQKFDAPIFVCRNIECSVDKVFGEKRNVIKMFLSDGSIRARGVLFKEYDEYKKEALDIENLDILYVPKINEYNGYINIEINIKDYQKSQENDKKCQNTTKFIYI